jgi:heme/copper-type cytochrome/quinol oxidase subunit 2
MNWQLTVVSVVCLAISILFYRHVKYERRLEEPTGEVRESQHIKLNNWFMIILFFLLSVILLLQAIE